MDHRILLKKYMRHVFDATDGYQLDLLNSPIASVFIDHDEERELFEIQQEIENEPEVKP